MRKQLLLLLGLLLLAAPARAQDDYPRGEVFLGYSYANLDVIVDRLHAGGFEISGTGNPHPNIGLEGDLSGHFGSLGGVHFQNWLFLAGPRLAGRYERVTPFAHALFGANHFRIAGESSTDFAMAWGGGLDVNVSHHAALRVVQADYVYVRFSEAGASANSHNLRLSFGVTFRWGH
ncbi:MAG: outer membrane beta-barrel protein [Acidobacteria bacterium]|nr:outer membrane beta-barrel protein [Acidobacteriota bacterium]